MADGLILDLSDPQPEAEVRAPTPTLMDELDRMYGGKITKPSRPNTTNDRTLTESRDQNSNSGQLTTVLPNDDQKLKEIQEKFGGRWTLLRSDPYDDYLKAVGIGYINRKLASNSNIEMDVVVVDKTIKITTHGSMYSEEINSRLDQEITNILEKQAHAVRVVCKYEHGKLTQHLSPVGLVAERMQSVERRITESGEQIVIHSCGDRICRRYFGKTLDSIDNIMYQG